jgi:hypothetical protein
MLERGRNLGTREQDRLGSARVQPLAGRDRKRVRVVERVTLDRCDGRGYQLVLVGVGAQEAFETACVQALLKKARSDGAARRNESHTARTGPRRQRIDGGIGDVEDGKCGGTGELGVPVVCRVAGDGYGTRTAGLERAYALQHRG